MMKECGGRQMNELENLKEKIEEERKKLDQLVAAGDLDKSYGQSVIVDGLVEKYIGLTE